MHGEEFIADNMIKAGYAVISVDWRSADRSRYSYKEKSIYFLFFLRNQPIKIKFRGTCIISFYYKTKYLFIHL